MRAWGDDESPRAPTFSRWAGAAIKTTLDASSSLKGATSAAVHQYSFMDGCIPGSPEVQGRLSLYPDYASHRHRA